MGEEGWVVLALEDRVPWDPERPPVRTPCPEGSLANRGDRLCAVGVSVGWREARYGHVRGECRRDSDSGLSLSA